ncbi:M14 family zinc carboxypeptidase [Crossiella sp. CA-258035]|uniref:M14 family zinc carboxypeptidase n=1 Tax=Crossiella sp. CA-258035 TaxID=2981138 RepID=UPI0024BCA658|nr:M14 family zinc carboxypeptidase [Crossiella sp. CA-258035]WHT16964.1 M14 family zinc carboxypeptidase [Crossiella sp. CA-258035]
MFEGIRAVLAGLPEVDRYPTVDEQQAELDELAGRYPQLVAVRRVGTSRQGEPIRVASIGDGTANALVLGGPHPNEPVGGLTVRELGRLLCARPELRAGLRWHLVPCIDPDGARLNESWFASPGDREAYARGFYRPDLAEQPEWTFPHLAEHWYFDRMLPETVALSRLIDELRPVVQASLHNAEYGGLFHYTTGASPEVVAALAAVAEWTGLPGQHAVWEIPAANELAPGVLRLPPVAELTEGAPAGEGAFGASSAEYAARHGTVTVITEVPLWTDPRAADTNPSEQSLAETLHDCLAALSAGTEAVESVLTVAEPALRLDTPHHRGLRGMLSAAHRMHAGWQRIAAGPDGARPATVAEVCSFQSLPHTMLPRMAGTLLRLLDAERAAGNVRPPLRAARARTEELLTGWLRAADDLPGRPIPLRQQVAAQLGAVLAAAAVLRS